MLGLACKDDNHTFAWETPGDCPHGTPCLCGQRFWGQKIELVDYAYQLLPTENPIRTAMAHTLALLRAAKGEERSEMARRLAITITEMEKVYAYYIVYIEGDAADA
jgi:hypothetical protein